MVESPIDLVIFLSQGRVEIHSSGADQLTEEILTSLGGIMDWMLFDVGSIASKLVMSTFTALNFLIVAATVFLIQVFSLAHEMYRANEDKLKAVYLSIKIRAQHLLPYLGLISFNSKLASSGLIKIEQPPKEFTGLTLAEVADVVAAYISASREAKQNLIKCVNLEKELEGLNYLWVSALQKIESLRIELQAERDKRKNENHLQELLDAHLKNLDFKPDARTDAEPNSNLRSDGVTSGENQLNSRLSWSTNSEIVSDGPIDFVLR